MPTPSAIDLLKKELTNAPKLADRALRERTEQYKPEDGDSPEKIARRLGHIRAETGRFCEGMRDLLHSSAHMRTTTPLEQIEGSEAGVQSALDVLQATFDSIEPGSTAESTLVDIAHAHAKFRAQMAAMLVAVELIEAAATPRTVQPLEPDPDDTPTDPIQPPVVVEGAEGPADVEITWAEKVTPGEDGGGSPSQRAG
ncbi:MAG: hypothetical protein ABIG34_00230 [Candidatus Peregrinibacteria bacterium]